VLRHIIIHSAHPLWEPIEKNAGNPVRRSTSDSVMPRAAAKAKALPRCAAAVATMVPAGGRKFIKMLDMVGPS
jgi:hypothetical protein